jgi:hypothetical protein
MNLKAVVLIFILNDYNKIMAVNVEFNKLIV